MKLKREKDKPLFRPVLNEKSMNLSKNRKSHIETIWKQSNEAEISFTNFNQEDGIRENHPNNRSLTPGRTTAKSDRKSINTKGSKTPRIHEVEYTPAMDFLLKKIA